MTRPNSFSSGVLSELIIITFFILFIPVNSLDYDVLTFTSTWKMLKDNPNHIPENMIG